MNKEITDYSWRFCWVRGKPSTEEIENKFINKERRRINGKL